MNIIGQDFTPAGFAKYASNLNLPKNDWHPSFVVRHSTGSPTLAQRPNGFTHQHMLNLLSYYQDQMKWHAGPHLFIDDHKIWVFSPLTLPGVNSPSWNSVSFGVEQLGDYQVENYHSGRGLAVQQNAVAAIAVLSYYGGIDSHTMRDHCEDQATTHKECPGSDCHSRKAAFMDAVHAYITTNLEGK